MRPSWASRASIIQFNALHHPLKREPGSSGLILGGLGKGVAEEAFNSRSKHRHGTLVSPALPRICDAWVYHLIRDIAAEREAHS